MCGINIADNWILQMNYPNVVTNRIMSLADVFNTPLTLRRKKKPSYKNKCASLHLDFFNSIAVYIIVMQFTTFMYALYSYM